MHEDVTMNLKNFMYVLKKRSKLISIVTLLCMIISGVLSFFIIKPTYQAGTTIIVGKPEDNGKNINQYNDVMMYQNLVKTYVEIAKSTSVANEAILSLNGDMTVEELSKTITVTSKQGTQMLQISATSKDPQQAVQIVKAVSSAFMDEAKSVFPTGGSIQIMDKPQVPESPISPNKALNIGLAFFFGLVVALGLSFVLEYMDSTIKNEEDIAKYLDVPVIGIIPKHDKKN